MIFIQKAPTECVLRIRFCIDRVTQRVTAIGKRSCFLRQVPGRLLATHSMWNVQQTWGWF